MRQATELLTTGQWLVVFPEGEIYRTNDRLTPLREGVAFMATTAAKDLAKAATGATIRIVPTAIRYRYIEDVTPKLEEAMDGLEDRMMLRRLPAGTPLRDRILRFGDAMLTLKEKEQLGHSNTGDLAPRLKILVTTILDRLEIAWLKKSLADESVSMRVKTLRQHLIEKWIAQDCTTEQRSAARAALDDVQLVMQLYSYPGDYVTENPTLERMAETVEKFEEDVYGGVVRPKGPRAARVILAPPIDVAAETATLRPRAAATQLTAKLETTIKTLMGSS
jgi:hypothetical protein